MLVFSATTKVEQSNRNEWAWRNEHTMRLSICEIIRDILHGICKAGNGKAKAEKSEKAIAINTKVRSIFIFIANGQKKRERRIFILFFLFIQHFSSGIFESANREREREREEQQQQQQQNLLFPLVFPFLFLFIEFAVAHNCDQVKRLPLWLCPLT